jgi:hypothetical protein
MRPPPGGIPDAATKRESSTSGVQPIASTAEGSSRGPNIGAPPVLLLLRFLRRVIQAASRRSGSSRQSLLRMFV